MKTLKTFVLTLSIATLGTSALQAMENQTAAKLSVEDTHVLVDRISTNIAQATKALKEAEALMKCLPPEALQQIHGLVETEKQLIVFATEFLRGFTGHEGEDVDAEKANKEKVQRLMAVIKKLTVTNSSALSMITMIGL